ncbi:glycosyltransferase family 52 [Vibrio owensii]|uniref:glycosyltransferase family 52 n=1 Tax=Vibrio owensii TaxID=696485 RepID=UPI00059720F5|nr:glycosyltransferase family 52 [Vibrio owensii]
MKSEVYCCQTSYHLYQTLLLASQSKAKAIVIVTDFTPGLHQFSERLEAVSYIEKVIYIENEKLESLIKKQSILKKLSFLIGFKSSLIKTFSKNYPFLSDLISNADHVNVFVDKSFIGHFICYTSNRVKLYDDGEANYFEVRRNIPHIIKHYVFRIPFGGGRSDSVIEVNYRYPSKVPPSMRKHIGCKLKKIDIDFLESTLSLEQKTQLINVFSERLLCNRKNAVILFTQPFSEDRFIEEARKIEIYRDILESYIQSGCDIFIKPHPREKTSYSNFHPNVSVLPKLMPAEVLNLNKSYKFNTGIAIQSTALDNASYVTNKVTIGYERYPDLHLGKEMTDNVIVKK